MDGVGGESGEDETRTRNQGQLVECRDFASLRAGMTCSPRRSFGLWRRHRQRSFLEACSHSSPIR